MALPKLHYLNTGKDGILNDTKEADVDLLFAALHDRPKIVLHFHGGLVSKESALASAEDLKAKCYDRTGAYPVFFVWESGLLEILRHNLPEIFGEDIFKTLLKLVLQFGAAKLGPPGAKAATGRQPSAMEVYAELAKREANLEPFANLTAPPAMSEVSPVERAAFEAALARDPHFQASVQAIVDAAIPPTHTTGAKGTVVRSRASAETLMSPEVVEAIKADAQAAEGTGAKGILGTAKLIKDAAEILIRVVRRFRQRRDHGLYPTVVEEILRQFYVANVGEKIWSAMKTETAQAFEAGSPGATRGGRYFADKLQALLATGRRPQITLVGHSAGAVYINHLLAHLWALRTRPVDPLPADFAFEQLLLLAPACTFEHFLPSITERRSLFRNFRMFTMTEAAESQDTLVPYLYTRSLLYFISGVLEPGPEGGTDFDRPLVGLQRDYAPPYVPGPFPAIATARAFLDGLPHSRIWSPVTPPGGPGLDSQALKHGDFDNDPATRASLAHLIGP